MFCRLDERLHAGTFSARIRAFVFTQDVRCEDFGMLSLLESMTVMRVCSCAEKLEFVLAFLMLGTPIL